MANPRYNSQVTQPRGNQARVGKMGGGMMMQRPMYKKGGMSTKSDNKRDIRKTESMTGAGKSSKREKGYKLGTKFQGDYKGKSVPRKVKEFVKTGVKQTIGTVKRAGKKAGGRIAGAARRAQQHGYYTPDMGMKGGKMYAKGGKVSGKKQIMAVGRGKAKNYPGIKKLIEMNKKGKKKFRDGGSAMKPVDKSKNPGLAKLPTQVRNKMGYMKDGGKVKKSLKEIKKENRKQKLKEIMKGDISKEQIKNLYHGRKFKDGGMTRNTRRMNRLEELGRVDAEKGRTRKGKRNLRDEKKRIVRELKR